MHPKWTVVEDEILRRHYRNLPLTKLIPLLPNRTASAIKNRAAALDVMREGNRRYRVDDGFFSHPNPLCSYWAGFIAADGNI